MSSTETGGLAARRGTAFGGAAPAVDPGAWIAPTAMVVGAVTLAGNASVFYGAVVRADTEAIRVGERTNLQDGVIVHADPGFPADVGAGVSVGHRAVLHGCRVADNCLIGMGAIVLNGADIGADSVVAAGAVVLEGTRIPPGSLVAGVPAKVRRPVTDDEKAGTRRNAAHYVELARAHAQLG